MASLVSEEGASPSRGPACVLSPSSLAEPAGVEPPRLVGQSGTSVCSPVATGGLLGEVFSNLGSLLIITSYRI